MVWVCFGFFFESIFPKQPAKKLYNEKLNMAFFLAQRKLTHRLQQLGNLL